MMYKGLLPETQLLYVIEKKRFSVSKWCNLVFIFFQLTELKVYFLFTSLFLPSLGKSVLGKK